MTVMGDALVDGLSDAGSTPARSTYKTPCLRRFFYYGAFINLSRLSQFRMIQVLLSISLVASLYHLAYTHLLSGNEVDVYVYVMSLLYQLVI